jgi:hypothetical protein
MPQVDAKQGINSPLTLTEIIEQTGQRTLAQSVESIPSQFVWLQQPRESGIALLLYFESLTRTTQKRYPQ